MKELMLLAGMALYGSTFVERPENVIQQIYFQQRAQSGIVLIAAGIVSHYASKKGD